LKVYGYNGCPFCGKVRAFLNYYGFEYEDVEVNPITKVGSPSILSGVRLPDGRFARIPPEKKRSI